MKSGPRIGYFITIVQSLALSAFTLHPAEAVERSLSGKAPSEIIALFGEPTEKIEMEVKRQERWIYQRQREVVFQDGSVRSVRELSDLPPLVDRAETPAELRAKPIRQLEQAEVEEILSEIMGEPSSDDDGPHRKKGGVSVSSVY